ncbi:hypothetical protein ACFV0H_04285 [Streptomyces erythrochromogenes]|uniref:hypothetical protein n=1 Tax=Streptomyces erythrochromogenes TaxID=285574 RepID=UPI002E2A1C5F|nr:hypothetical protein [Streptomyces erythrochromogenes]
MTTAIKPEQPSVVTGPKDGMPSMLAYLTRVLKVPTIGATWEELAEQALDQNGPTRSIWPPCCSGRSPTANLRAP